MRENPEFKDLAIQYFQSKWANEDCTTPCIDAKAPLPQWYLLMDEDKMVFSK